MTRIHRNVFGDTYGLAMFCSLLVVYLMTWRIGFFINDTFTVANALVAVSDGHLSVVQAVYGDGLRTPGMFTLDGQFYSGGNYGQVVLALPFLSAVEFAAAVASLRVAIAATWSLLVVAVAWLLADLIDTTDESTFDHDAWVLYGGSAVAISGLLVALRGATPIEPMAHYLIALQLQMIVAAAFIGVVTYRLLTQVANRRVGLAAGVGIALSAPIGFWASIPKRHILVVLAVISVAYFLFRSRKTRQPGALSTRRFSPGTWSMTISESTVYRALAYVPIGLVAWVNAGEGVLLLIATLAVDLPTGRRSIRSIVAVAAAIVLSSLPMFVTSYLISGNPLRPPQLIQRRQDVTPPPNGGGSNSATPQPSGEASVIEYIFDTAIEPAAGIVNKAMWGFTDLLSNPEYYYPLLIRSRYDHQISYFETTETIRLSVLESLPVAAALIALPFLILRIDVHSTLKTVRAHGTLTPRRTVDAFLLCYVLFVGLMFAPRLTTGSQITGRYVLAAYPALVYGVARLSAVQRVLTDHTWTAAATYLTGVGIGGQLLFIWLYRHDVSLGEASQIHGTIGFVTALLVAGWILLDTLDIHHDRLGAVSLGVAAAAGTVFVFLAKLWYFSYGNLAL